MLIFIIPCQSEKSNSTVDKIFSGQPTKVEFHVTVMSLDSINEGSMVSHFYKIIAMMTMILGLIKIIMKSLISPDSGRIPILADIIYGRKI